MYTVITNVAGVYAQMEELKAEALLSPAPSINATSPTAFQTFQSRLQRAGYDLARKMPDQAQVTASDSDDSSRSGHTPAAMQPEGTADDIQGDTGQQAGRMESSGDGSQTEEKPAARLGEIATAASELKLTANPEEESDAAVPMAEEVGAAGAPQDEDTVEGIESSDQVRHEAPVNQRESSASEEFEGESLDGLHDNESSVNLSKHAASLSTVLSSVPIPAIEGILGGIASTADASSAAMLLATMMSAGDTSAQAALDALVEQIIDSEMQAEQRENGHCLAWPGLSEEDLCEPENLLPTSQQPHEASQENDSAPRPLDAHCVAPQAAHTVLMSACSAALQQLSSAGEKSQQEEEEAPSDGAVRTPAAAASISCPDGFGRQPEDLEEAGTGPTADIRRRCDKALHLSGVATQRAAPDCGECEVHQSRLGSIGAPPNRASAAPARLGEDSVGGSRLPASDMAVHVSSEPVHATVAGSSPTAGDRELQRMRAAMLAIQVALAQQAANSAYLQRRMHSLEGLHSRAQSEYTPRLAQMSRLSTPYAAAEPPAGALLTPRELQGFDGVPAHATAAARKLHAVPAQQLPGADQLPQHLLVIGRHMARMEAAMTALYQRMELLQGLNGATNRQQCQELACAATTASGGWEQGCWGDGSAQHASPDSLDNSGEPRIHSGVDLRAQPQQAGVVSLGARHRRGSGHLRRQPGDFIARRIAAL